MTDQPALTFSTPFATRFYTEEIEFPIPFFISRALSMHLDRLQLQPSLLLLLKCAACICMGAGLGCTRFPANLVATVHPITHFLLGQDLSKLVDALFFDDVTDDAGGLPQQPHTQQQQAGLSRPSSFGSATLLSVPPLSAPPTISPSPRRLSLSPAELDDRQRVQGRIYQFRCGYMRDVCYQLMLFRQRRIVHRAIIDAIERKLHAAGSAPDSASSSVSSPSVVHVVSPSAGSESSCLPFHSPYPVPLPNPSPPEDPFYNYQAIERHRRFAAIGSKNLELDPSQSTDHDKKAISFFFHHFVLSILMELVSLRVDSFLLIFISSICAVQEEHESKKHERPDSQRTFTDLLSHADPSRGLQSPQNSHTDLTKIAAALRDPTMSFHAAMIRSDHGDDDDNDTPASPSHPGESNAPTEPGCLGRLFSCCQKSNSVDSLPQETPKILHNKIQTVRKSEYALFYMFLFSFVF